MESAVAWKHVTTIIIVEDDASVNLAVSRLLEAAGFDVRSFMSAGALLADRQLADARQIVAHFQRHLQDDERGVQHGTLLEIAKHVSAHGHLQRAVHIVHAHTQVQSFLAVHLEAPELHFILQVGIHVSDVGRRRERFFHVARDLARTMADLGRIRARWAFRNPYRARARLTNEDLIGTTGR